MTPVAYKRKKMEQRLKNLKTIAGKLYARSTQQEIEELKDLRINEKNRIRTLVSQWLEDGLTMQEIGHLLQSEHAVHRVVKRKWENTILTGSSPDEAKHSVSGISPRAEEWIKILELEALEEYRNEKRNLKD